MQSAQQIISAKDFTDHFLEDETEKTEFRTAIESRLGNDVAASGINKDTALVDNRLKRVSLNFDSDVRI